MPPAGRPPATVTSTARLRAESAGGGTAPASLDRTRTRRTAPRRCPAPGGSVCRSQAPPGVRAGLVRRDRRHVHLRRIVLQIVIEKRAEDLAAEIQGGVAVELQR